VKAATDSAVRTWFHAAQRASRLVERRAHGGEIIDRVGRSGGLEPVVARNVHRDRNHDDRHVEQHRRGDPRELGTPDAQHARDDAEHERAGKAAAEEPRVEDRPVDGLEGTDERAVVGARQCRHDRVSVEGEHPGAQAHGDGGGRQDRGAKDDHGVHVRETAAQTPVAAVVAA
jgi:hypothetical protein